MFDLNDSNHDQNDEMIDAYQYHTDHKRVQTQESEWSNKSVV